MPRRYEKDDKLLIISLNKLLESYNPYQIQCALANIYEENLQKVEPDYIYIPKSERKKGEEFIEPETAEGRYWLKVWLGSRNLCSGMEKWLNELIDELEENDE